ncbi:Dabb family protein [Salibaculum sp.]|uniref:Dabb family protein n=1 Tax=Salibaculum sp. TaxID=2855480 RepID=UPI002B45D76E|nr:Dabb family protein [Salibaculum sp.]HKL69352.1 Dabb family protein [Salibaculum sp.]
MIRHIVFFSAKAPEDVQKIEEGLTMLATIPEHETFEVRQSLNADALTGGAVDVVVYAEFADEAALARYKAHPTYQNCIDVVRPLRELRLAADIAS